MNVHNGVPASSQACVYCWPAFSPSIRWDEHGYTCCAACAEKPKRVCMAPKFLFRPPPLNLPEPP